MFLAAFAAAGKCNNGTCVPNCANSNCTGTTCAPETCNPSTGGCVLAPNQPSFTTECDAGNGARTGTCSSGECISKCAGNTCAADNNNECGSFTCQPTTGQCVIEQSLQDGTLCPYISGEAASGRCSNGRCTSLNCYNNCPQQTECTTYTCNSVTQACDDSPNQRLCTVNSNPFGGICGPSPSYTCQPITHQKLTAFTPTEVLGSSNAGARWGNVALSWEGQSQGTWAGRNIAASSDGMKLLAARTGGRVWRSEDK
jgi:hypothetical protein